MPSIGARCHELRVPDEAVTWRVFFRIDADAIVILDVTTKKTRATPKSVLENCKRGLALYDRSF
jgi:phage-related protein